MKPITISDFLKLADFADLKGITPRQLEYRLSLGQVAPRPMKLGQTYIFTGDEQIIIPTRPKPTGRPKGTTIENGAKRMAKRSLKYPRNKAATKKIKMFK